MKPQKNYKTKIQIITTMTIKEATLKSLDEIKGLANYLEINLSFQDARGVVISNPRRCHLAELIKAFSHKTIDKGCSETLGRV